MDSKRMIQPVPGKPTKIPVFKNYVGTVGESMQTNIQQSMLQRMSMPPLSIPPIGFGIDMGVQPLNVMGGGQQGGKNVLPDNLELPKGHDGNPITREQLFNLFPHLRESFHVK